MKEKADKGKAKATPKKTQDPVGKAMKSPLPKRSETARQVHIVMPTQQQLAASQQGTEVCVCVFTSSFAPDSERRTTTGMGLMTGTRCEAFPLPVCNNIVLDQTVTQWFQDTVVVGDKPGIELQDASPPRGGARTPAGPQTSAPYVGLLTISHPTLLTAV